MNEKKPDRETKKTEKPCRSLDLFSVSMGRQSFYIVPKLIAVSLWHHPTMNQPWVTRNPREKLTRGESRCVGAGFGSSRLSMDVAKKMLESLVPAFIPQLVRRSAHIFIH